MNIQCILEELQDDADECIAVALADAIFCLGDETDDNRHRELRLLEADRVRRRLESNGFEIVKIPDAGMSTAATRVDLAAALPDGRPLLLR